MKDRIQRIRAEIVLLLFLATIISYLNRQVLSVNAPLLRDELGLSNFDYSAIVSSFLIAYTVGQAGSGWIIDRLGTRLGFSLFVIAWSIAGSLHSLATSALTLGICRFFFGLFSAGSWPGSMRAVAEWYPPRDRGSPAGVFGSGTSLGAILAPPLVVLITARWGWRSPFLLAGLLGFVWLVSWWFIYWPPGEHPELTAEERLRAMQGTETGSAATVSWRELLRHKKVWGVILGRMCSDPAWWFFVFWLPEYLTRVRGYSMEMIGLVGWLPYLSCYIGNLGGGFLSNHLIRRGMTVDRARKSILYVSALGMTAALPAYLAVNPVANLALISLATLAFGFWAVNILTVSADVAPAGTVGVITGLGGMGAGIGGMLFTLATGWLVDQVGYFPVFSIATLLPLAAAASVALLVGRIEPLKLE